MSQMNTILDLSGFAEVNEVSVSKDNMVYFILAN